MTEAMSPSQRRENKSIGKLPKQMASFYSNVYFILFLFVFEFFLSVSKGVFLYTPYFCHVSVLSVNCII